jgi:hypothetical protein
MFMKFECSVGPLFEVLLCTATPLLAAVQHVSEMEYFTAQLKGNHAT